ncbi:MAG: flagellar hook-associated protein FlgL [Pseudomonadota bacterium]
MRISTSAYFATSLYGIQNQQSAISRLNQQIASGQRMLAAKDDPVANARAMGLENSLATRSQFASNQLKLELVQKETMTVLNELDDAFVKAREVVSTGQNAYDPSLREQAALTLNGLYKHIAELANYRDTQGNYLFSGHETDTRPFVHTQVFDPTSSATAVSAATTYAGDAGVREIVVDSGRTLRANESLTDVLQPGVAGADLLQILDQLAIDLRDTSMDPATLQANLSAAYDDISNAMDALKEVQTSLAGRQLELADVTGANTALININEDILGELTQVEQERAIVELQQRQTILQAAMSAFSSSSRLSLFNYLG